MKVLTIVKSDFNRYIATGANNKLKIILFNQGFIFTVIFRVNTGLYSFFRRIPLLNKIIGFHCLIWLKLSQIISGLSLPVGLQIGKGLLISHSGTIIINGQCKLGENINLAPDTVIGYGIKNGKMGYPKIGSRVFIGPGAKIFGPISIGDDVMIGANAVVNIDVPDKAVVAGVPAKVVSYKGSSEYIKF
ncbi:MAG: serine acetyltransferase [Bacteroidales bacterium]|nr:serine acetyltransferase [Bacteroidales bacterium]